MNYTNGRTLKNRYKGFIIDLFEDTEESKKGRFDKLYKKLKKSSAGLDSAEQEDFILLWDFEDQLKPDERKLVFDRVKRIVINNHYRVVIGELETYLKGNGIFYRMSTKYSNNKITGLLGVSSFDENLKISVDDNNNSIDFTMYYSGFVTDIKVPFPLNKILRWQYDSGQNIIYYKITSLEKLNNISYEEFNAKILTKQFVDLLDLLEDKFKELTPALKQWKKKYDKKEEEEKKKNAEKFTSEYDPDFVYDPDADIVEPEPVINKKSVVNKPTVTKPKPKVIKPKAAPKSVVEPVVEPVVNARQPIVSPPNEIDDTDPELWDF